MGTKTNSGTRSVVRSASAVALACSGLLTSHALANNWITPGSGAWTDPANWTPAIPDGVDAVADFSQVDLTADAVVTLGTAHTVGTLNFGDTDVTTAGGWTLSDATQQTLTLSATNNAPTINVGNLGAGKAVTIASLLSVAANQVVTKTGAGTLIFTNAGNAATTGFAGILEIQQGTFQVAATTALPNFDPSTIRLNGGTMRFSAATSTGRIFTLGQNGGTLAFAVGSTFNGAGALQFVGTGSRTLTLNAESGTTSITSIIGDGSGGATSLVKAGTGAITLTGANTFTGTVAVNSGTLTASNLGGTATNATTYTGGGVTIASGATAAVSRATAISFAGPVSGAGNLTVNITNDGTVALGNATYTGTTAIQRGTFNYSNAPSTSNYVLGSTGAPTGYGVINLDNGDFTAPLGTTGGGVTWAASGGFANPNVGTRVVALGGTASPTPLQLNVGGFVAGNGITPTTDFRLKLGATDASSLGTVDFRNNIDLNGRRLTVTVDGQAISPGILSGNITGSGAGGTQGLYKFGNASLTLSGNNTYTGLTQIVAGATPTFASAIILGSAGAFSPNTNMQLTGGSSGLTGGVLGLGFADGNFTLGTGNGQVQFVAGNSGGFGAYGANRTVTLNGGGTLVYASTAGFLGASQNLILALQNSDATLTFNNSLDVNGSNRGIVVNNGTAAIDAVIAQPITNSSGTAAGINKLGVGTLALTASNTYSGVTTVTGGTLVLSGSGTFGAGQINNNSAIVLANTTALAVPNTFTGTGTLTKSGAGTATLSGTQTYTGPTIVTGGTLRSTSQNVLTNAGGLDIQNGGFSLDYTGASPAATVRGLLAASFTAGAGVMNTGQIKSTTATAAKGLGYRDDGTGSVLIKAALFGDADLDGGVSINDFNSLAGNFGQSTGKVWVDGDFDYDGGVSINDFNLLAGNFGQSLPASSESFASLLAFAAAHNDLAAFEAVTGVPEPTSLGLIAAGATLGLRRRRR